MRSGSSRFARTAAPEAHRATETDLREFGVLRTAAISADEPPMFFPSAFRRAPRRGARYCAADAGRNRNAASCEPIALATNTALRFDMSLASQSKAPPSMS